ncbi:MAG: hypothetical protein ACJ763_03210 [Bdellovibrionia bacterium]
MKQSNFSLQHSGKRHVSSLLALSVACISLFGCDLSELSQKKTDAKLVAPTSGSSSNGAQTGGSPTNNAPATPPAPSAPVNVPVTISSTGTAGIRDFIQVVPAMSAVTGIPMSNTNVQRYYSSAITRMSVDGSGTAVSSALLATYTTMASIFCQELVTKESPPNGPAVLFADLDYTKGVSGLTPAARAALLKKLTQQFWGRDPSTGESASFNTMLDEISTPLNGVGVSSTEKTKTIALSACTTILSSLDFLKN